MRAALRRYAAGRRARVPFRFAVHLIAARYGTSPAAVRAWPAGDYLDALTMLPYTAPAAPRAEHG